MISSRFFPSLALVLAPHAFAVNDTSINENTASNCNSVHTSLSASAVKTEGVACPQGSVTGQLHLNDSYSLKFTSSESRAEAKDPDSKDARHCQYEVTLQAQTGKQMRVQGMQVRGSHISNGHAETSMNLEYALFKEATVVAGQKFVIEPKKAAPADVSSESHGFETEEGAFDVRFGNPDTSWTACGESVQLIGSIDLNASRNDSDKFAEIALHDSDMSKQDLTWQIETQDCEMPVPVRQEKLTLDGGQWKSEITDANTPSLYAMLQVEGNKGSFKTALFSGKLYKIVYKGDKVSGLWKVSLRKHGWFEFNLSDAHHFTGTWGTGHLNKKKSGSWSGTKS